MITLGWPWPCVTCIAWQTHRDHVVRPRCRCCHPRWRRHHRWCRRRTFCFFSITIEGMHCFHSNFAGFYITIKYRSSSRLVIIRQILAELWPFFDLVFVVRFWSITFEGMRWFHSNFAELYITVKYRSSMILVIIRQILAELWPFFDLVFHGVLVLVSNQ